MRGSGELERVATAYRCAPERDGLLEELSAVLRRSVPFEAAAWFGVDPLTVLPTAPAYADGLWPQSWAGGWAHEFSDLDVLLFRQLARAAVPVGSLHHATEAVPERSPRYRHQLRPLGVADELRAVFRLGSTAWGQVTLLRCSPGDPFGRSDLAVLSTAGPSIAAALRARTARMQDAPSGPRPVGPGSVLFTLSGRRSSMNRAAAQWFVELAGEAWDRAAPPPAMAAVVATVARANALAPHGELGPSVTRVHADNGRWVELTASATRTDAGEAGLTSLVVDAACPSDVAAVLVEALALTRRERDVTGALMLGLSNAEIAHRLRMSAHTVRDHLAAIFSKAQVGSRGELVARLLGEPSPRASGER